MTPTRQSSEQPPPDWWPCGCMKRAGGKLTHVKLHPPETLKCHRCGATKAASDRFREEARLEE